MGREAAHQLIKRHSTTSGNFFESLAKEKEFPLSIDQLKNLIKDPLNFASMAAEQSRFVTQIIKSVTDSKITKVELDQLR
jgi:ABC-type xylose transport system substrate-binding protein